MSRCDPKLPARSFGGQHLLGLEPATPPPVAQKYGRTEGVQVLFVFLQHPLRGGNALHALVAASGGIEGAAEGFEGGLGDVVSVAAAVLEEVEVHPGLDRDCLEELVHQLGVEGCDPAAGEV